MGAPSDVVVSDGWLRESRRPIVTDTPRPAISTNLLELVNRIGLTPRQGFNVGQRRQGDARDFARSLRT